MQVGIFNCLFIFVIAALNDYVIVASIIVITIRNLINCAAPLLLTCEACFTEHYLTATTFTKTLHSSRVYISVDVRSFSLTMSEQSQYLLRNEFSGGIIGFMGAFHIDIACLF